MLNSGSGEKMAKSGRNELPFGSNSSSEIRERREGGGTAMKVFALGKQYDTLSKQ